MKEGNCLKCERCRHNNNCVDSEGKKSPYMKCMRRKEAERVPGCLGLGVSGEQIIIIDLANAACWAVLCVSVLILFVFCSYLNATKKIKRPWIDDCTIIFLLGKAYCYDVRDIPTNSKSIPPLTSFENKCKPGSQCEVCQGPCYESGACKDGLNCVILDKGESLPGCGGIGFTGK